MSKKKKTITFFIMFIVIIGIVCFALSPLNINADSGFDSSYDSGGSFDSGSSFDSSSESSGDGSVFDLIFLVFRLFILLWDINPLIAIIVFAALTFLIIRFFKNIPTSTNLSNMMITSNKMTEEELKKYIPEIKLEEFLVDRYNDYLDVQNAWMEFDYDSLRKRLTDELYNQYEMQLDTLKIKNQKNVMKEFVLKDSAITNIEEDNNKLTLTMEMIVEFYDYITENDKVVRGNSERKITQHYEMTFVCSKKFSKVCPNCGAKLENAASNKCEFCGSIVTELSDEWVLSKKESKRQY